ncbi:MAG: TIM barrel protein [Planctomycetota bacterium]|jgi:sugar phosphate isomerase/epimerase|nr:TIM barrel protein [Planctomycetota bacterium]
MGSVIITGFGDESANQKTVDQQFSAFAACGLQYYSIRFIDVGNGVKNVMQLTEPELDTVIEKQNEYGLAVSSLGSPLGKVKLLDKEDGTQNRYVEFNKYLDTEVKKACELASRLGTKLLRGFSFYHPKGTDPAAHVNQVSEQIGRITEVCKSYGLVYGLEIEANLVGQSGQILAEIHSAVNMDELKLIWDGGNIVSQGIPTAEVVEQYRVMKPGLGWLHIKDYRSPVPLSRQAHVNEDALKHFVPADLGDSGHEAVFNDLKGFLPELSERMSRLGVPGVFLDLEPHVKGGGQFGGFSGPDGFGVAMRGLCKVLEAVGIDYHIRDFNDVVKARGF